MSRSLIKHARLTRRQLILFALVSAIINGVITATVGSWLAQSYSKYQSRRASVEKVVNLVYERRTRAGLLASAIRRNADLEEVRHRKQAYDEAYVDWNKNVMINLFVMREVAGDLKFSSLEPVFEDNLVSALADVDRCLTKAYDARIAGQDGKALLVACGMPELHQFVLDCGATFTNELYKLTQLSFVPFYNDVSETKRLAEERITKSCKKPDIKPQPVAPPAPPVAPEAPAASATPAPEPAAPAASPAPPSETPPAATSGTVPPPS